MAIQKEMRLVAINKVFDPKTDTWQTKIATRKNHTGKFYLLWVGPINGGPGRMIHERFRALGGLSLTEILYIRDQLKKPPLYSPSFRYKETMQINWF